MKIIGFLLFVISIAASGCGTRTEAVLASSDAQVARPLSADPKVAEALALIEKMPDSARPYLHLATVYIQKARSTGDFGLYAKAQTAIDKAGEMDATDLGARKLKASLHLTYHRFDEALKAGNELLNDLPQDPFVFGVISDANAELGNYDEAVKAAQRMVDIKPNSSSYARVAHLRSLYGDHKGSIEVFTLAARTADPQDPEAQAWCLTQLADEHWRHGEFDRAQKIYDEALGVLPDYYLATFGKGRVLASKGDLSGAKSLLSAVNHRVPSVDASIWLGDVLIKSGDAAQAAALYALAEAIDAKIGVNNDQKRLALMWANNNSRIDDAIAITTRESGVRQDVLTLDALAWTLYRGGRFAEAKVASDKAMRLKTNDATMLYHAGMIANALGSRSEAKKSLKQALDANPVFDLIQADEARRTLETLK